MKSGVTKMDEPWHPFITWDMAHCLTPSHQFCQKMKDSIQKRTARFLQHLILYFIPSRATLFPVFVDGMFGSPGRNNCSTFDIHKVFIKVQFVAKRSER